MLLCIATCVWYVFLLGLPSSCVPNSREGYWHERRSIDIAFLPFLLSSLRFSIGALLLQMLILHPPQSTPWQCSWFVRSAAGNEELVCNSILFFFSPLSFLSVPSAEYLNLCIYMSIEGSMELLQLRFPFVLQCLAPLFCSAAAT